jgi:hypothetical protein
MAEVIHKDWQYKSVDYPAVKADYDAKVAETNARVASAGPGALQNSSIEAQIPAEPRHAYTDEGLKRWTDMLDGQIDNSGRNDQLTMISIQELKATIDQGSQLASTLISSSDKTSSSILNNFV